MTTKTRWIVGGSIVLAFIIGVSMGGSGKSDATPAPKVETKTVTVTPPSCRDLIETDNGILSHTATALNDFSYNIYDGTPFTELSTYVKSVTPQRQAQVRDCEGS